MNTKEVIKNVSNGNVTDTQIGLWKQHGKVMEIAVSDGDTTYIGYFKRPTMETMSAVNKLAKTDEVKGSMVMFDNCWLGGDEIMKSDAIIKMAALTELSKIFQSCSSSLKNL